jgi:hypothetical protein
MCAEQGIRLKSGAVPAAVSSLLWIEYFLLPLEAMTNDQ